MNMNDLEALAVEFYRDGHEYGGAIVRDRDGNRVDFQPDGNGGYTVVVFDSFFPDGVVMGMLDPTGAEG